MLHHDHLAAHMERTGGESPCALVCLGRRWAKLAADVHLVGLAPSKLR